MRRQVETAFTMSDANIVTLNDYLKYLVGTTRRGHVYWDNIVITKRTGTGRDQIGQLDKYPYLMYAIGKQTRWGYLLRRLGFNI